MSRMLAAVLAATVLLTSPSALAAAPRATLAAGDVQSITIDSTWSGLGRANLYHGVISRSGGVFTRDDGSVVDAALIDALLDALTEHHPDAVTPADVGLSVRDLKGHAGEAEDCLQSSRAVPAVRSRFEQQYFDYNAIQPWLDNMFRSRHTDDYPKFSMTITTMSGNITVSSTSQQLFMLPMLIAGDGLDARVFDPAVPHAIAALLPGGTVNRQRMEAGSLLLSWASDICMSKSVREQQNVLGKDKITALATSCNLTLTGFGHNTGLDRWVAEVADPADPRVTEQVQSNDAKAADDFAAARKRLDLVHHIPWLQHQVDITPDAYVWINYGPGIFQFDPPRFRKMNRPHVAALLEAHASDAMTAWVGEKNGNRKFADFYFLPNGTMILQEFYPGVPPFPFAPGGYEKLPTIGTVPAPFVNSPTWLGGPFVVGLIIHPDGTIETKDP